MPVHEVRARNLQIPKPAEQSERARKMIHVTDKFIEDLRVGMIALLPTLVAPAFFRPAVQEFISMTQKENWVAKQTVMKILASNTLTLFFGLRHSELAVQFFFFVNTIISFH